MVVDALGVGLKDSRCRAQNLFAECLGLDPNMVGMTFFEDPIKIHSWLLQLQSRHLLSGYGSLNIRCLVLQSVVPRSPQQ